MGVAKLTNENTIVPESRYALVERERKFLLNRLPEELNPANPHIQITDNYITGTRLRLRKVREPRTNKWTLKFTQKFAPDPNDLSHTIITNVYLNAAEYNTLGIFEANEIRKNRYPFDHEGRHYGIDVFMGDLLGLIIAEISFDTDEDMSGFTAPAFALAEVTNNEMFTGAKLTELTFADIRQEFERGTIELLPQALQV